MKSKIYSSRYMKISSKGMIWIPAFVTIGFFAGVSGDGADHAGKLVRNGVHRRADQPPL